MDNKEIEFMRATLLAVSPHYPGFEQTAMLKNINELCDAAILNKEILASVWNDGHKAGRYDLEHFVYNQEYWTENPYK